jgi:tetratricopeptide (TPR) repeat protein
MTFSQEEKQLIERVPTTNLTAHDYFLRAREEHWEYLLEGDSIQLQNAEDLYNEARKNDSSYAQAYTGLAWVYFNKHRWDTFFSKDYLDSMLILANIALTFDNQLSEAYVFRGQYYQEIGKSELAIEEYDKAILLNPNDWYAYYLKATIYRAGNLVEKIENYHKAISLNRDQQLPMIFDYLINAYCKAGFIERAEYYAQESFKLHRDSSKYYENMAFIESTQGNYSRAIDLMNKQDALSSKDLRLTGYIGTNYVINKEYKDALECYKRILEDPDYFSDIHLFSYHRIGLAYWKSGYKEEGEYYFEEQIKTLNEINALGRGIGDSIRTSYDLAAVYAFLGEKDKAYNLLEKYYSHSFAGLYGLSLIKNDPLFDSIRNEPEFQQIVRDVEAKYQAEHERVRHWLEENDML